MDINDEADGNIPVEYLIQWKEYQALKTDEEKEAYKEAHPEFAKDWRAEFRLDNPEVDARLALWGYSGKLQSMEAYDLTEKMAAELGIPFDAATLGLPPRDIAPAYFELNKIVSDTSPNSVQSKLYKLTTGKDLLAWGIENGVWTDDLSNESIEALTLRDEFKDLIAERKAWTIKTSGKYIDPDESIKVNGETVNKRQWTYEKQLADNPQFREALDKIKVYELSKSKPDLFTSLEVTPEQVISEYLPYSKVVDEFGAASSEAKLARYDSQYLNKLGLNSDTFTAEGWEPLDEAQVPIWRIDKKYRNKDTEYDAIDPDAKNPDTGIRLRDEFLQLPENEEYRKDRIRRKGYGLTNSKTGYEFPDELVEDYVIYTEYGAKGKRQERFLVENDKFAQALYKAGEIADLPKPEDVPAVQYDDIYDLYPEQFDKIEGIGKPESIYFIPDEDKREAERYNMMFTVTTKNYSGVEIANEQLTEFGEAYYRREAYELFIPDNLADDYVGWKKVEATGKPETWAKATNQSGDGEWYEDDWYLIEHPRLYAALKKAMRKSNPNWHVKRDEEYYSKVPTRDVFQKYLAYLTRLKGKDRDDYRWDNLDLDAWLVAKFDYTPIEEQMRRQGYTPSEKLGQEIDELIRRLKGHP